MGTVLLRFVCFIKGNNGETVTKLLYKLKYQSRVILKDKFIYENVKKFIERVYLLAFGWSVSGTFMLQTVLFLCFMYWTLAFHFRLETHIVISTNRGVFRTLSSIQDWAFNENNFFSFFVFSKRSIIDILQGSEYAFDERVT